MSSPTPIAAQVQSERASTASLAVAIPIFLFGALLVFVAGFAQSDALHDAAHDARHAMSYPCH